MNEKIDEQLNILNEANCKPNSNLGTLEWLDDQHESCFIKLKDRPQFMGRTNGGKVYLNNEETLFMIEANNVICYYKSLQLSMQDAFDLMIKNEIEFERYMVYSYLLKFGFRVKRMNVNRFNRSSSNLNSNSNANKRPISLVKTDLKIVKRIKLDKSSGEFQQSESSISPYQLISNLNIDDDNDDLKFMRFLRFQKLSKNQHSNWEDLLDDFDKFISNKNDCNSIEVSKTDLINDENSIQFSRDFQEDAFKSLIHFNESLTETEIQNRLIENGPQADLDDYSLEDLVDDDYDYDVYLPNSKQRIQDTKPDYYLKIIHNSQNPIFPIDKIFKLNSKFAIDKKKLLFAFCQSNEINFYQFTDVDLVRSSVL